MAKRTEAQLAKEADAVQNACNLSGVVHSFARAMGDLWEIANERGEGTDWVNTHPVCRLFSDKIAQLTGTQTIGNENVMRAYRECHKLALG